MSSANDFTMVNVSDCVSVKVNNDEDPNVGKISAIWLDEQNYIRLSVIWFYRLVLIELKLY